MCTDAARSNNMAEYRSTGRELRRSPKGVISGLFLIALAAGGAFFGSRVLTNMVTLEPEDSEEIEIEVPDMPDESEQSSEMDYGFATVRKERIRRGPLMLVNSDVPTEDVEEGLVSVFEQKNEYLAIQN